MLRAVPVFLLILFATAPTQAYEYLPDGLAEVHLQFRTDRSDHASDGQLRVGFQVQPGGFLFFGVETTNPPFRSISTDHCGEDYYNRDRFWVSSWLGIRHERLRAGLRFTRNVETIEPPECGPVDFGPDEYKASTVTSTSVETAATDHPGAMLEIRFSHAVWAGVLYDHHSHVGVWAAWALPHLLFSLEAGRMSIPHPPFPSYTRTDARLGLRFSPWGKLLSRARFHLRIDLGLVHTDFEAQNGWTPDPPTAVQVRVLLAFISP